MVCSGSARSGGRSRAYVDARGSSWHAAGRSSIVGEAPRLPSRKQSRGIRLTTCHVRHSAGSLFDGYALTVNVTNGLLTVSAGAGALDPKINFIEIGAAGSSTSAALNTAVAAAATQATKDTAKSKAKTPPTVKRNVWGSYVDELVSYTVKKPRKSATRYFAHANHLYSVAAVTSSTGSVVERWSYNAYGVPTIKNSANATIAKSAVGNDRGFTGYKLDSETGLYFAKIRMYSAKLGRFTRRDSVGYVDGYTLYGAYFIPNQLDPFGTETVTRTFRLALPGGNEYGEWAETDRKLKDVLITTAINSRPCVKECPDHCGYTTYRSGSQKITTTKTVFLYDVYQQSEKFVITNIYDIKITVTSLPNSASEINGALDSVWAALATEVLAKGIPYVGPLATAAGVLSNSLGDTDVSVYADGKLVKKTRKGTGEYDTQTIRDFREQSLTTYGECDACGKGK